MKAYNFLLVLLLTAFGLPGQSDISFLEKSKQTDIAPTHFHIRQKTAEPTRVTVRYGTTASMSNTYTTMTAQTEHDILLDNLTPATFYHVEVITETDSKIHHSAPRIMATASESSGEIRYYFNNGVNEDFSNGVQPDGDQYPEVLDAMYDLIDNAQLTIDVAVYNTSWYELVNRLEDAVERGVRVRYIHDEDTNNVALQGNLDFPTLAGSPSSNGIMHNKFMVTDAADPDNAHVLTGSMNWSFGNITEDHNNTVIIQDQTLALNYTIEFEEMWGSTGEMPDAGNAKFGAAKTDNTAHNFNIGGVEIECYFSPSDAINTNIEEVINGADETLEIAMLLITKEDVTAAIKNRYFAGVNVRGIFDNDDTDEFTFLESQNVNVVYHYPSVMLHHKYAVADASLPDSDPTVLTGSHNWTYSAETFNDENTLIFHDANVANLFLQEFEKRWDEVGPNTATNGYPVAEKTAIYPNPFTDRFTVNLTAHTAGRVTLDLYNSLGRQVYFAEEALSTGENELTFRIPQLLPGTHYMILRDAEGRMIWREHVVRGQ